MAYTYTHVCIKVKGRILIGMYDDRMVMLKATLYPTVVRYIQGFNMTRAA